MKAIQYLNNGRVKVVCESYHPGNFTAFRTRIYYSRLNRKPFQKKWVLRGTIDHKIDVSRLKDYSELVG